MRIFVSYFSFLFVLISIHFKKGFSNSDGCENGADPAYCGRPSAIADLLCFSSGSPSSGQSYLYLGFDDYITAFCSYYYDCQPSQRAYLNILDVYGYIFNLTYTMKNGTKGFNLYYVDVTVPGCPQFQKLELLDFNPNVYDTALLHTPKPIGISYDLYREIYQDKNLSCNTFPSIKVKGDDCSNSANPYSGYVRSPYMFKTPTASVDFSHIKNVQLNQVFDASMTGNGETLVEDNGLYATCVPRPKAFDQDGSILVDVEYCTADRYDNFPYCNRFNPESSLSKIVESYGYDKYTQNCLNASTACTISTLYAQGFNKGKCEGNNYLNCNCNSFTTLCTFAFLLPEYASQDLNIYAVLTRGYCEIGLRQDIMRKFLAIC